VWDWSPVLTAVVVAGWEPVLEAVGRLRPEGPVDPRVGAVLEPVTAATAVGEEELAGLGPVEAAVRIAGAPDAGGVGYVMVLHRLVAADPAAWTADVPAVLDALRLPGLAGFYLGAAAVCAGRRGAFPDGALSAAVAAALDLRRGLGGIVPTVGSDGVRRWSAGMSFAGQALFDLLTVAWRGEGLAGDLEKDAVAYLHALVDPLAHPVGDAGEVEEAGEVAAAAAGDSVGVPGAVQDLPGTAAAGGPGAAAPAAAGEVTALVVVGSDGEVRALGALLEFAVHRARTAGGMPGDVLDAVGAVLAVHAGEEAVATAVGVRLPALYRYAPAFTAAHRTALFGIGPGRTSPAVSWLRWGAYDRLLLAALGRVELLAALRAQVPGADGHLAHALLEDPTVLGDPGALWGELAGGTDEGAAAVSGLLEAVGGRAPRAVDGVLLPPAAGRVGAAVVLWRAALAAGLPAGALAGAGAFADAAVEEAVWLELMRASAEHSQPLTDADLVAERAAAHPDRPDALLLAALLVTHAPGTWQETAVRRHARALLDAATALPSGERPRGVGELRTALVNAGDLGAAARR
jgi:hypothetical protein